MQNSACISEIPEIINFSEIPEIYMRSKIILDMHTNLVEQLKLKSIPKIYKFTLYSSYVNFKTNLQLFLPNL